MRVLVIDDDTSLCEAVERILKKNGCDVICADSAPTGKEALETNGPFDFILLDYKMPEKDAIWFLKNTQVPSQTKILVITAFIDNQIIKQVFENGACGYIAKPFSENDILRHLTFHQSNTKSFL